MGTVIKRGSPFRSTQLSTGARVHQLPFCRTQKGRGPQASDKSKTPKLFHPIRTLQNGVYTNVKRYLTVPIWQNRQKYIRFLWRESLLEIACLPFGLESAPRVFTKLLKPVNTQTKRNSTHCIPRRYPSYGALNGAGPSARCFESKSSRGARLYVNYLKSVLVPSQQMEFLRSLVNSLDLSLSLPRDKIRKIQSKCQDLLNTPITTV